MEIKNFDSGILLDELEKCFSDPEIEELARSSKFIQRRTSRLSGKSFLEMNVFDPSDGKERSLNDSCDWLEDHHGISMTKQSLDERYNTDAVRFMRGCFDRVMKQMNQESLQEFSGLKFSKIQLTDATSYKIPPNLSTFYRGHTKGVDAVVKMHFNYDLLSGKVEDLLIREGVSSDHLYKFGASEKIDPKALYIRDLGYFNHEYLASIIKGKGKFLSRAKSNSVFSKKNDEGKYERMELADYLPAPGKTIDLQEIYLGSKKKKNKVRLIIQAVPDEVGEERLRRLEAKKVQHKNWNLTQQAKNMCWFNVYVTNTTAKELPSSMVRLVYSLRWQIELIFKIWKSVFKIDKIKKMSIFRFECYIYSKLIAILLTLRIQNKIGQFLWEEEEFEISPMKAAKLIKKND